MAILYKMNCEVLTEINKSEWMAGFLAMKYLNDFYNNNNSVTSLIQLKSSLTSIYDNLKHNEDDLKV